MTEQSRARGATPWVVAVVLALVTAALVLALVHVRSVGEDNDRNAGRLYRPTDSQQDAVQAGATEAANLLTYSRKNFAADFALALKGTTGGLRSDLSSRKASTLSAMTEGKFDLKAVVVESAFESESGGAVLMLVTLNGSRIDDTGVSTAATPSRLELTMVRSGGQWLASKLTSVGIQ